MNHYDVYLVYQESFVFRVQARDEDEAMQLADEMRLDPKARPVFYDDYQVTDWKVTRVHPHKPTS